MPSKSLQGIKLNKDTIIKFINSQLGVKNLNTFIELRGYMKTKYRTMGKMRKQNIEEQLLSYKAQRRALESLNVESLSASCLSVLAIIIGVLAIIIDFAKPIEGFIIIGILITYIFLGVVYVILQDFRSKKKSKQLVYYDMLLEVLEEILCEGTNQN